MNCLNERPYTLNLMLVLNTLTLQLTPSSIEWYWIQLKPQQHSTCIEKKLSPHCQCARTCLCVRLPFKSSTCNCTKKNNKYGCLNVCVGQCMWRHFRLFFTHIRIIHDFIRIRQWKCHSESSSLKNADSLCAHLLSFTLDCNKFSGSNAILATSFAK